MKLNTYKLVPIFSTLLFLVACSSSKHSMSTLEIRSIQTKEYDSKSELVIYKALVNALLDREFIIKASDSSAGIVLANYTTTRLNGGEMVTKAIGTYFTLGLNWVFGDNNLEDTLSVDISANVTQLKGTTQVRINAIAKRMNSEGEVLESNMIVEPAYYNGIFEQIGKSVFLEQNLTQL
jgi:hypothetical protein